MSGLRRQLSTIKVSTAFSLRFNQEDDRQEPAPFEIRKQIRNAMHRGAMRESSQGIYPLDVRPLTILSRRVSDAMILR